MAVLAAPVGGSPAWAQQKPLQASPEQAKAIEAWTETLAVQAATYAAPLGFQIGAALSGGLTPFIAAALMAWSGGATWPISLYLIGCALLTGVATAMAPETARRPIG